MMFFNIEDDKVYTIKDIQKYTNEHNVKMLSEYDADFWKGYKSNYQYFDRLFMKRFTSWYPFDQDPVDGLASIQQDFTFDVYSHLLANDKRYSELWRVNVIPDNEAYSLTNNVDYTETYSETNGRDITFNKGAETDTEDLEHVKGSQTNTEDLSRVKGSQTDTEDLEFVKGSETDTEDLSKTLGEHETETKNSTSAYNSSTFEPVDKTEVDDKEHTDTEDNSRTFGERTDTEDNSRTYGERTDTEDNSRTEGQRTDTDDNSRTYGAREDTTEETGSKNYTNHKVGNMGVQTVDDMLLKHWNNWTMFNFYEFVFDEIAANLLRGC